MASKPKPRETLLSFIRVQENYDRRLYSVLRRTASDLDRQIRLITGTNIGAVIRREQLIAVRKATLERLRDIATANGLLIEAAKLDAQAAAIKTFVAYDRVLMQSIKDQRIIKDYLNSAVATSRAGLAAAEQRLLGASYHPLAESVYDTLKLQTGQVDRFVESALARGLSAREIAKEAVDFIKPTVRGGASYSAMRLGRTEINNAFHATQAQRAREVPWVEGVIWNLSGSHPKPDECNDYADNAVAGHPAGWFAPDDIPAKPHPQCLCFTTPDVDDEDTWLDNFFSGKYDSYLAKFAS